MQEYSLDPTKDQLKEWTAHLNLQAVWSSDKLNAKYEATKEIGIGGQAKVYMVSSKNSQQPLLAVKAICKSHLIK